MRIITGSVKSNAAMKGNLWTEEDKRRCERGNLAFLARVYRLQTCDYMHYFCCCNFCCCSCSLIAPRASSSSQANNRSRETREPGGDYRRRIVVVAAPDDNCVQLA